MTDTTLRQRRGQLSLRAIADLIGVTPQMLGAIERGTRTPSLALAKKIADYYGVSVDEIFFGQSGNETCPSCQQTGTHG